MGCSVTGEEDHWLVMALWSMQRNDECVYIGRYMHISLTWRSLGWYVRWSEGQHKTDYSYCESSMLEF